MQPEGARRLVVMACREVHPSSIGTRWRTPSSGRRPGEFPFRYSRVSVRTFSGQRGAIAESVRTICSAQDPGEPARATAAGAFLDGAGRQ